LLNSKLGPQFFARQALESRRAALVFGNPTAHEEKHVSRRFVYTAADEHSAIGRAYHKVY
jgi:hypothetical protein